MLTVGQYEGEIVPIVRHDDHRATNYTLFGRDRPSISLRVARLDRVFRSARSTMAFPRPQTMFNDQFRHSSNLGEYDRGSRPPRLEL